MAANDLSFRSIDLNLLRVFDALLSEGSVAGAATRLRITPSAVSHALNRLRSLFSDPLFTRSPNGMQATPRAVEIGAKLRAGLHRLESALAPADFVAEHSSRQFTLACSAYISAVLLPGVIARMRQVAPRARLAVRAWGPGVLDQFVAGRIDLLLGDFARVPEGFERQVLFEDRPVWLVGRDYVLPEGMQRATPEAMRQRFQFLVDAAPRLTQRSVSENGFERRTALEEDCGIVESSLGGAIDGAVLESLPYSAIAPLLVKQADLAALLPYRLALLFARQLGLDIVDLPLIKDSTGKDPTRDESAGDDATRRLRVAAVWPPGYGCRAPVVWLRALLAEVAAQS